MKKSYEKTKKYYKKIMIYYMILLMIRFKYFSVIILHMVNKSYMKGYRKERSIVNRARARGCLSFRSAGSHSAVDVVIVDRESREIQLIQCKPDDIKSSEVKRLLKEGEGLDGQYTVGFYVI